jgi:hypothetical protein
MQRLIEAAPSVMTDNLDNLLTTEKGRRAYARDLRAYARQADRVSVPSKWYATDGSGAFYYFRHKKTYFIQGDNAFGRIATTAFGGSAMAALVRHQGQLTDRRPSGWMSAATIAAVNYGGFDGNSVRAWGWTSNEDLDLDVYEVDRLRAQDPGPFHRSSRSLVSAYAEQFGRALAGAR